MKTTQELEQDGFTTSGLSRYEQTVEQYADALYKKSITFGDSVKANDLSREVTHEHVRSAAQLIANSFGKSKTSAWWIVSQITEYVLTATSAFALGNTTKPWSTPVFVISTVVAGILISVRISKSKRESL